MTRLGWVALLLGLLVIVPVKSFAPVRTSLLTRSKFAVPKTTSLYFQHDDDNNNNNDDDKKNSNLAKRVWKRMDTLDAAGFKDESSTALKPMYQIGFKRGLMLAALAFAYKWYRARFINKIPVWDRQPQWNTVVTNREQEKELKAYTCKNCGSTIFIARHRGWFFEGKLGLAGLGCYTCGAKGKDNFVMDRDRIVEDVGDDDDYFDYEQPLDFVSAAERRKLMKQAGGDEDVANQILMDRAAEAAPAAEKETSFLDEETTSEAELVQEESSAATTTPEEEEVVDVQPEIIEPEIVASEKQEDEPAVTQEEPVAEEPVAKKVISDDDVFDMLDMD